MWKPALFFLTIVLVTPNGRAFFSEHFVRASSQFFGNSLYSELAIGAVALALAGFVLLLLCQSPRSPEAQWIRREVRTPEPAPALPNRTR
jgi:hypothetical protein